MVTNTLKIMGATMLLLATSNDVGVNVRLVGYGLSVSRHQGIYRHDRVRGGSAAGLTNVIWTKLHDQRCKEANLALS